MFSREFIEEASPEPIGDPPSLSHNEQWLRGNRLEPSNGIHDLVISISGLSSRIIGCEDMGYCIPGHWRLVMALMAGLSRMRAA